ncbi:MAG: hypothetical protein AB1603_02240 [Chloroflexota bacterium]
MGTCSTDERRPLLVCLIGVDGTGKTTQAQSLVKTMAGVGMDVKRVPCRWDSATFRALMRVGIRLMSRKGKDLTDYGQRSRVKKSLFSNQFLAVLYQSVVLAQYVLHVWTKVKIPLLRGKSIVCDRYIYDSVIDLAVDFHYSIRKMDRLMSGLLRILPRPDLVFLIDLAEETAFARNIPKGERLTADYFSERVALYRYLTRRHGMVVVDGAQSVEEIGNIIESKVLNAMHNRMDKR